MKKLAQRLGVPMLIAAGIASGAVITAPEADAAMWIRGFHSQGECNAWIFDNQFPGINSRCEWLAPSNEWAVFYDYLP